MLFYKIELSNMVFSHRAESKDNYFVIDAFHTSFVDKDIKEVFRKAKKYAEERHIHINAFSIQKLFEGTVAVIGADAFSARKIEVTNHNDLNVIISQDAGKYLLWVKSGFSTSWVQLPTDFNSPAYPESINNFNAALDRALKNELEKLDALEERAIQMLKQLTAINDPNFLYKEEETK